MSRMPCQQRTDGMLRRLLIIGHEARTGKKYVSPGQHVIFTLAVISP